MLTAKNHYQKNADNLELQNNELVHKIGRNILLQSNKDNKLL